MISLLWSALQRRQRERRVAGDHLDTDASPFGAVARDLMASLEEWPLRAIGLLDGRNWNYPRLVDARGACRKPQVTLVVEITSKGNLVLEWYPGASSAHPGDATDCMHWSDQRVGYQDPEHRIVMFHEFGRLGSFDVKRHRTRYSPADQDLIEAVHLHLHDILSLLRTILDVHLDTDLSLEYRSHTRGPAKPALLGFQVRRVPEVEQQRRQVQQEHWLRHTFRQRVGVSPERFLTTFREAHYQYATTSTLLRQQQVTLSAGQVRRLVHRLYHEHHALYERHCPGQPPGSMKEELAKVLLFPRPEGTLA